MELGGGGSGLGSALELHYQSFVNLPLALVVCDSQQPDLGGVRYVSAAVGLYV